MPVGKGTDVGDLIENIDEFSQIASTPRSEQGEATRMIGDVVRAACNGWASGPEFVQNVPPMTNMLSQMCDDYLSNNGGGAPRFEPSFQGGQCAGVTYLVDVFVSNAVIPNTSQAFGQGPIRGVFTDDLGNGNSVVGIIDTDNAGQPRKVNLRTIPTSAAGNSSITSIGRVDGTPDNCGDPPPTWQPGVPVVNYNYGDTISFNDYERTVEIVVNEPFSNINGDIEFPFTINGLELDLFGGGDWSSNSSGGDVAIGPGVPDGPQQPVGEEGIEGEASEGTLRGVAVTIPSVPETPRKEFGSPNPLYYNLGWVAFGNDAGYGAYDRIIADEQYFFAPRGATKYRVKLNPFVVALVQPYLDKDD